MVEYFQRATPYGAKEKAVTVPIAYLRECFDYEADTGTLTWKHRPVEHFTSIGDRNSWNARYAGKRAGRVSRTGYLMVGLTFGGEYKKRLGHRIIWAVHHGQWPRQTIDHKNRVRSDNRIANLEDVSHLENNLRRLACDHSSARGVRAQANGKFAAYINLRTTQGRRQRHLGIFETADLAHRAFLNAREAA